MKLFVAPLPLFNADMVVEAYRLSYQKGDKLFGTSEDYRLLDGAMHSPGIDLLNKLGIEPFTGGRPIFVNINQYQLLADFQDDCGIRPELIRCVFSDKRPLESVYHEKGEILKEKGFFIALDHFEYRPENDPLYKMADYVLLDSSKEGFVDRFKNIRTVNPSLKVVLTRVSSQRSFDRLKTLPNTLFGGNFYAQPITKGVTTVSPVKVHALRLLRMTGEEDFDLDAASGIISQDTALSISLLKFINSPGVGLSSRVNSIRNAVAMLGQKETAKWVAAGVSSYLGEDKPGEITRLSLIRAKFAENLAPAFEMAIHSSGLFLMGLFSLLDVILEMPMARAVQEIYVDERIRAALVESAGMFGQVLLLILDYERADWKSASYTMVMNNVSIDKVNNAYLEALAWYKKIWEEAVE